MRNVTRDQLGDPADVLDQNRKRDAALIDQQPWRQAIRDQQNPQPKQDRYSAMYERLILKRGNDHAATEHLRAETTGSLGYLATLGIKRQTGSGGVLV